MILAERERVIDTFPGKHMEAGRVLLENTEAYRALNGEEFEWGERTEPSEELKDWYKSIKSMMR